MCCKEQHVNHPSPHQPPAPEMEDRCGEFTTFMFSFPFPPSLVLGLASSSFPIISARVLTGAPTFFHPSSFVPSHAGQATGPI